MKYANGKASTASVAVTRVAIPTVRPMIDQYVESVMMIRKLSRFQDCTICVVKGSMVQNAVIRSVTSAAR